MNKLNFVLAYSMAVLVAPKREEKGATAVEYALVIGLVSLIVVAAVAAFGPKIQTWVDALSFS